MATFDCLNTELLFEIFDYLSFDEIVLAFFNLQQRINDIIRTYPVCIDLSMTTDRRALVHGPFLCCALTVMEDDSEETPIDYLQINFDAIRTINFKYINSIKLQLLLKHLPIEKLESITIEYLDREGASKDIEQYIWSIITIAGRNQLQHLYVSDPSIQYDAEQLLTDMPSLKCVTFKEMFAKEMLTFMHYTPNLRSLTSRITVWNLDDCMSDFSLLRLTHLNLCIHNCDSFEELHQILSICPYLTHFILQFWIKFNNEVMIDATTDWQTLIEECLPNIIYLKIRLYRFMRNSNENLGERFNSSEYWLSRKPQFDIQVYDQEESISKRRGDNLFLLTEDNRMIIVSYFLF
jgi:hypothetical protein